MATACQVVPSTDAFASNLLAFLDCQASTLGAGGYQALSAPGATGSVLVGLSISIFVALWGYRLLLGDTPGVRDLVIAAIKTGVVLTLAASWPAYQTLIYDVVLRAPAQLASAIGASQDLPGATGGLAIRLDGVEAMYRQLEILGPGVAQTFEQQQAIRQTVPPGLFMNFDTFALGMSRLTFLSGVLGSVALVRLTAGILLALAPIFAGLLLFDATRPLFAGWLKTLVGVALAALAVSVVIGVELALLEPWLQTLLAQRSSNLPIAGVPGQLLAVTVVFSVTLAGVMAILAQVATRPTMPLFGGRFANGDSGTVRTVVSSPLMSSGATVVAEQERTRALMVADAIATTQRRENDSSNTVGRAGIYMTSVARADMARSEGVRQVALGQSFRRRTTNRASARAAQRDRHG